MNILKSLKNLINLQNNKSYADSNFPDGVLKFNDHLYIFIEDAYPINDFSSPCGVSYEGICQRLDKPDDKLRVIWYPINCEAEYEDETCDWTNPDIIEVFYD